MQFSVKEQKRILREQYQRKRREIISEEKRHRDDKIRERLEKMPLYRDSSFLLCYVSLKDEVDTKGLIRNALTAGKKVCVPLSDRETCTLGFYEISSLGELAPGAYGVLEPAPKTAVKVMKFPASSVCVVPGMVFDRDGYRLGYGKGYYDRFLSEFRGIKIGLCYSDMILGHLPLDVYDCPVDWLVTEKEFIQTNIGERRD